MYEEQTVYSKKVVPYHSVTASIIMFSMKQEALPSPGGVWD